MHRKTRKILVLLAFSFLFAMIALSCANGGDTKSSANLSGQQPEAPQPGERQVSNSQFSDVEGIEWFLEEVKTGSQTVSINRVSNPDYARVVYSIRFEDGRLGGTAAPNSYSAPYTTGENNGLSVGMAVSTMMAPLFEVEGLKENDFLIYLGNIGRWNLVGEKLELYTKDNNGTEAVLVWGKNPS